MPTPDSWAEPVRMPEPKRNPVPDKRSGDHDLLVDAARTLLSRIKHHIHDFSADAVTCNVCEAIDEFTAELPVGEV